MSSNPIIVSFRASTSGIIPPPSEISNAHSTAPSRERKLHPSAPRCEAEHANRGELHHHLAACHPNASIVLTLHDVRRGSRDRLHSAETGSDPETATSLNASRGGPPLRGAGDWLLHLLVGVDSRSISQPFSRKSSEHSLAGANSSGTAIDGGLPQGTGVARLFDAPE